MCTLRAKQEQLIISLTGIDSMYRAKEFSKSKSMIFALYIFLSVWYTHSMQIKVHIVKAFTQDKNGGNPAGVILHADYLPEVEMQQIATYLNFSECVFVSHSSVADYRFRYFTPTCEVDACAHATIAACHMLPTIQTYATNKGVFRVEKHDDGGIVIEQGIPVFGPVVSKKKIYPTLGIDPHINMGVPAMIVSTGVPKLLVPIADKDILFSIRPDREAIKQLCIEIGCKGIYAFTLDTNNPTHDAHTRQFNPLCGIDEDPVTGTAAGALGAYLYMAAPCQRPFIFEQGDVLGSPGLVRVYVADENTPVKIHGYAVIFDIIELK